MKGFALLAVAGAAAVLPASAAADTEATPAGPATVLGQWLGPVTTEGRPPEVLVAVDVGVAPGGQAGTIRIRAGGGGVTQVGEEVQLPAEPGTYRFPAPHVRWDRGRGQLGFDQATGGHMVVGRVPCAPERLSVDPCETSQVTVTRGGEPETLRGAGLSMNAIYEPDLDQDLVGDKTEDRTDLKVSATTARDPDGRLRIVATLTNAGPRVADLPELTTALNDPQGGKQRMTIEGCAKPGTWWQTSLQGCVLDKPLAVGETRAVALTGDVPEAATSTVTIASEGPDLQPADNTVRVHAGAVVPLVLAPARGAGLRKGVAVGVTGVRDGRVRVTAAFQRGGRTVKLARTVRLRAGERRDVRLKPKGAKLRALRRLADGRSLRATITVRSGTGDVARAKLTVKA